MAKRDWNDPRLPTSPCDWNQQDTRKIYKYLGVDGKKIPAAKHGVFNIDGWKIIVKRGTPRGGGKPRVFADYGGRLVDVGRIAQALCPVRLRRARKKATRQRGPQGRFGSK
jgi:hypothetical protein